MSTNLLCLIKGIDVEANVLVPANHQLRADLIQDLKDCLDMPEMCLPENSDTEYALTLRLAAATAYDRVVKAYAKKKARAAAQRERARAEK
jgi:hypothetical protein